MILKCSGENPICPSGKLRTLGNVLTGWKGCGKAGVCACARELVSAANKATKQANSAAKQIEADTITIKASDEARLMGELHDIIRNNDPKNVSQVVKGRPEVYAFVLHESSPVLVGDDIKVAEMIYITLHGAADRTCALGNQKTFNTFLSGYRFCQQGCECDRAHQSKEMIRYKANLSDEERQRQMAKQVATLQHNYGEGVTNPMHVPGAEQRRADTCNERFGFAYPSQSAVVQDATKATNQARLGVDWPGQSQEVRQKVEATNLIRHGETHTMTIARRAFKEQTGFANPFMMAVYQAKAAQTRVSRYDTPYALQVEKFLEKQKQTNRDRRGVDNPMRDPTVKAKMRERSQIKYKTAHPNQAHFTPENYATLQDPEAFGKLLKTLSLREVAMKLGISYDGCRRYCAKYGIELPSSSYEDAISAFLRGHGFALRRADRKTIRPLELDIVIESHKVAIEFCGLYWHGDGLKGRNARAFDTEAERVEHYRRYHAAKLDAATAAGYRLITIFEDEWVYKTDLVKSRLLYILQHGSATRLGAREAEVTKITSDVAAEFFDKHHLQGGGARGFVQYGAYDGQQLTAVMSFGMARPNLGAPKNAYAFEVLRFATDGTNQPGIASRLFACFVDVWHPYEVISYADRRWSAGGLYEAMGFSLVSTTRPNYFYCYSNRLKREHRWNYRKSQIKHRVADGDSKTEYQIMQELGYYRIWDCGSLKYVWRATG